VLNVALFDLSILNKNLWGRFSMCIVFFLVGNSSCTFTSHITAAKCEKFILNKILDTRNPALVSGTSKSLLCDQRSRTVDSNTVFAATTVRLPAGLTT